MNSKQSKIQNFNPNDIGNSNHGIFGLPFTVEEAEIVIIPFPWEVTVSYKPGTAEGPLSILEASRQIDLYDPKFNDAWKLGIALDEYSEEWKATSDEWREKAAHCIEAMSEGHDPNAADIKSVQNDLEEVTKKFNAWVKERTLHYLNKNKLVVGLGGDHSTPLGLIEALSEKHESFAVLQIDAHCDLRNAYEGFEYSHASIMYNVLKNKKVSKLVQVGIRDYCEEEVNYIEQSKGRVKTFFDRNLKHAIYNGKSIKSIHQEIIDELPQKVFLSFDIDGLDPKLCPNTGTPVAGGLEFEEVLFLIETLVDSGRQLIGFDLNEVATGDSDWDANVAGRLLYRICNLMAKSNGKLS
ncbi:MAG: agmatinase family protein [Bacteroidetes bacterium]|nr:agmatinase family protein [Bacteroidota bacterium]MBK9798355.1 agmatinase family protein [Bacteroidota bacterium]